jgi:SAM-dependent methyltransferase
MSENSTIKYYSDNAESFLANTVNVDMSKHHAQFEKYLKPSGRILDLGCGSGRDSLHFLKQGYSVVSVDGSIEMCKAASKLTGQEARWIMFDQLDYVNEFDGIWACASLLHVSRDAMVNVLYLVKRALKDNGTLYLSYKYGNTQREKDGRLFSDYTEETVRELLNEVGGFKIKEIWCTEDVRPDRNEKWVNTVFCKQ